MEYGVAFYNSHKMRIYLPPRSRFEDFRIRDVLKMFVEELTLIVHPGVVRKLRKIFKKLAFIKMQKN